MVFDGEADPALVEQLGGRVVYSYNLVPAVAATAPGQVISQLAAHPRVVRVEPDGEVHINDTELDDAWGVKHIGAGNVHGGGNRGAGVNVAVMDSGCDYGHPDLDANYAGGYDFVNNDTNPMDDYGHGTHVSGTVAAEDNGVGVVGVAPLASLYCLKVLNSNGSGAWSDIIAALQWTVNNGIQIHVTNSSFGSSLNPGGTVKAAFDNAAAAGILHVSSAGNSGNPRGKGNNVGYPARFDAVMAVAATDKNNNRARFSSTGDAVELAAPGVNINSTLPGDAYSGETWNGTSMASPHVAGTAALIIAAGIADANGDGNINDEVRQRLGETAEDLGDPGRDPQYGFGLVDADAATAGGTPLSPAVNVAQSTDETYYVSGIDNTAVLTAVVTDETGAAISGLSSTAFATTLDPSTMSVTFTGTAGSYTGDLDISGLGDGTYTVEVEVTDSRGLSGSGSATFTIGPAPSGPTAVSVASIIYATEGGRNGDKHLLITVALLDDLDGAVSGASVSTELFRDESAAGSGTATTGTSGTVTFTLNNASSGCYTTTVSGVSAAGLTWDSREGLNNPILGGTRSVAVRRSGYEGLSER